MNRTVPVTHRLPKRRSGQTLKRSVAIVGDLYIFIPIHRFAIFHWLFDEPGIFILAQREIFAAVFNKHIYKRIPRKRSLGIDTILGHFFQVYLNNANRIFQVVPVRNKK
jgi:hypothetical protein